MECAESMTGDSLMLLGSPSVSESRGFNMRQEQGNEK